MAGRRVSATGQCGSDSCTCNVIGQGLKVHRRRLPRDLLEPLSGSVVGMSASLASASRPFHCIHLERSQKRSGSLGEALQVLAVRQCGVNAGK